MKVNGFLKDIKGTPNVLKRRKKALKNAPATPIKEANINKVAKELHPGKILLKVVEIISTTADSKTYKLIPIANKLPYFMAGQFLVIEVNIDGVITNRAYSICSAPYATLLEDPYVKITIKEKREDAFVSTYLLNNLKIDDVIKANVGLGNFHYDPIRDSKDVVAIAGGSGITPFVSMAEEIKNGKLDFSLTILYGSRTRDSIILKDTLDALKCDKVKVIHVLSDEETYEGEKGFIDANIIKKYSKPDSTYFICGPLVMYNFVLKELENLNIPYRRIRKEAFSQKIDLTSFASYDASLINKEFEVTVIRGIHKDIIKARADESLAVAIERAKIKIETACRTGACGLCHIKLVSGTVFVNPLSDGRRRADKLLNYIHACGSYPTSDLVIKIPIE